MDTRLVEECLYDILKKRGQMTRDALRLYGRSLKTKNCPHGCDYDTVSRKIRKLCQYGKIVPLDKKGLAVNRVNEFAYKYRVS